MASRKLQQGDIVWLDFDPQAGHEQGKRRPALIVSGNDALTLIRGLALVCPISGSARDFPTHVALDERTGTSGLVMCEQVKTLDIQARKAEFIECAPADIVSEVLQIIHALFD